MPFCRLAARDANKYTKRARPITFRLATHAPPSLSSIVVSSPPLFSIHFIPSSFSRCRAGILLSHSVYTGITINPGVGEVDQHPRRTFNYQGTVAERKESGRKLFVEFVYPASFESPRYRRAISPFPVSLSLSLFSPDAFVLPLSPLPIDFTLFPRLPDARGWSFTRWRDARSRGSNDTDSHLPRRQMGFLRFFPTRPTSSRR